GGGSGRGGGGSGRGGGGSGRGGGGGGGWLDGAGAGGELGVLALAEQGADLVRVEQAGQAEEVLFLRRACRRGGAELAAVVQHPVEVRGRVEGGEGGLVERGVRGVALAQRLGQREFVLLAGRTGGAEHMVPFGLEFGGIRQQDRDRRQEHGRGLAALPGPDEPADRLGEEQRGRHAGRVHADGEARDVHALGHHPHRDHPPVAGG